MQPPAVANAFELVLTSALEPDAGACNKVLNGLRYQHFRGSGERSDPGTDHDGDAANLSVDNLALASVKAGSNLETERPNGVRERLRATDIARARPSKGCEETVAGRVDLRATVVASSRPRAPFVPSEATYLPRHTEVNTTSSLKTAVEREGPLRGGE
jgi:hypothetical protein